MTRSQLSLKNQCLKIYRLQSCPILSYGFYFSIFFRRSFTVLLNDFLSKFIFLLFIQAIVQGVTPQKGLEPVSNQQKSRPRQQMSTDLLYPYFFITQGARYSQLPHNYFIFSLGYILEVKPKSHIFTSPFQLRSIFYGLRSLQISPFSCKLTIPNAICIHIRYFSVRVNLLASSTFLFVLITPQRSPWTQNSSMKQVYLASSNWQQSLTLYLEGYQRIQYQFFIISKFPFCLHSALLILFMQNSCLSYRLYIRNIQAYVPSPIFLSMLK